MKKWKPLDLRSKKYCPEEGELVALRMIQKNGGVLAGFERYDIGRFQPARDGKKLWFHSGGGSVLDPARLNQHNDIWWCPVSPFDGI